MESFRRLIHDPKVLSRLNAFALSYFGWITFGILYGLIGRWSVDITEEFLRLPLTSRNFVLGLLEFTRSVPGLYPLLRIVYYVGFSGSIALMVAYLLLYRRDLKSSDELLVRYILAYLTAGAVYLVAHIYAPHFVYNLPGYSSSNNLLTRQEFVLPSLHNTMATINILTVWKYRKSLSGKAILLLNSLIPFATVLLAHHWIYDVLTGILLGVVVSKVTAGWKTRIPARLCELEVAYLKRVTLANFLLAILVLLIALDPGGG
ncbi:phosphoesterase [Thermococcus sp. P6]|uniref:phosphatase PAP2 family protein n=1 Tax=Thermococcus sp. P6 TaxID=122420 RepID=UPI000B59C0A1|nr:phosphatase PAP2 family protein [Thermococcus sp. P6]ASJ11197.1 phosphoesterase [Thermococcus sp. P6]